MLGELIGEFKVKNTGWRVLPDGKIETTVQGTVKLGIDIWIVNTTVGSMAKGLFMGEVTSFITTMTGDTAIVKGNAIAWSARALSAFKNTTPTGKTILQENLGMKIDA